MCNNRLPDFGKDLTDVWRPTSYMCALGLLYSNCRSQNWPEYNTGLNQAGWQRSLLGLGWKVLSRAASNLKFSDLNFWISHFVFRIFCIFEFESGGFLRGAGTCAQLRSLQQLAGDTQEASCCKKAYSNRVTEPRTVGVGGRKERKGKERKVGDILKGAAALQRCCLLGLAGDTQGAGWAQQFSRIRWGLERTGSKYFKKSYDVHGL